MKTIDVLNRKACTGAYMSRNCIHMIYITLLTMGVLCTTARAQSLQDFVDAEKEDGCKSIPYSTQQGNCSSYQGYVDKWCAEKRSCEPLNLEAITRNIERVTEKLESLKEDKSKATTDEDKNKIQQSIDELTKTLGNLKQQVINDKYEMKKLLDNGEHCQDYRGKVQLEFIEATRKADGESNPAIEPVAKRLIVKWKDGMADHIPEFQKTSKDVEYCKKQLAY
jgi:hypothetical protein